MSSLLAVFVLSIIVPNFAHNRSYNCEEDKDCSIVCNNNNSCTNTIINCPINHGCNITCELEVCNNFIINASHSSSLEIYVYGLWLSEMTIYSPTSYNSIPKPKTHIYDQSIGISEESKNILQQHIKPLQLFAINGFNDIKLHQNRAQNTQEFHGNMHCAADYSSHCEFSSISLSCIVDANICDPPVAVIQLIVCLYKNWLLSPFLCTIWIQIIPK